MIKRITFAILAAGVLLGVTACDNPANVASRNLSYDADNFKINRRIVFYNGITNQYMLTIEGLCSLGNFDAQKELTVTCETGPNMFKKDFLGLSDNVTYFVEQMEPVTENTYHYKVTFAPSLIVPEIAVH